MEGTVAKVRDINGRNIIFMSLYQRPRGLNLLDLETISGVIAANEAVIGEDLNAKHIEWGGNETNASGRLLREWLENNPSLSIRATNEPTRICETTQSYIDIFMSTPGLWIQDRPKTLDFESDHRAIMLQLSAVTENQQINKIFDYNSLNKRLFINTLTRQLQNLTLPIDMNINREQIDTAIETLTDAINIAMETAMTQFVPSGDTLSKLPHDILHLIAQKKTTRRRLQRIVEPQEAMTLKAVMKTMSQLIGQKIKLFEQQKLVEKTRKNKAE